MIYLLRERETNQFDTATAETEPRAVFLEARGFGRVLYEAWRDAREENDTRDRERIALDDWLARQNEPAPGTPEPGTAIGKTAGGWTIYKG